MITAIAFCIGSKTTSAIPRSRVSQTREYLRSAIQQIMN